MAPKVLIVDDDPSVCRLVELRFSLDDFEVSSALTSEEALRLVATTQPDVVVVDVVMPDIDGFEVCRRIRADDSVRQPVIVMLTARVGAGSMVAGLAAGADDYVTKPPNLDALVEQVRARLRQRERRDASVLAGLPGGTVIAAELRRRLEAGEQVAVLSVDLDGLGAYNERYGFERGDAVLEWVAEVLVGLGAERPGTFVGRLGSDDFVVVTDPASVEGFGEAFGRAYEAAIAGFYDDEDAARGCIEVTDERGQVRRHPILSFSVGATTSGHGAVSNETELLERAVEMEHYAKLRSGNRIVVGP